MALTLKTADPGQGLQWVRGALRVFARRPLALTAMLMGFFLLGLLVATLLPVVGGLLTLAALPLLSLGFMIATHAVQVGEAPHMGMFFSPLRGPARNRLAMLGVVYAALLVGGFLLCDLIHGGELRAALQAMQTPPANEAEILAGRPDLLLGPALFMLWAALLSVPFWHAPALIHWGHQTVAQSLFSSTLACWRNKGAFLVYGLAWLALGMASSMAVTVLLLIFPNPQWVAGASLGVAMVLSTVFYASLYFTFVDSFAPADAAAGANIDATA
jgi:hypothetical protein